MKILVLFLPLCAITIGCAQQEPDTPITNPDETEAEIQRSVVEEYFLSHVQDSLPGISIGDVHNGSLKNSTVVPFAGENFIYFDTTSYLSGRAHTRPDLSKVIQQAYARMTEETSYRFVLMELSLPEGGEIQPHRTHRNGLSADFMTPLVKDGEPYTALDLIGGPHYLLEFDDQGRWKDDPTVSIDFNLVAAHLLALHSAALEQHLKINKVIWKMELRDELLASPKGKELSKTGIYITQNLTPLINRLHDDHYHVDFEVIP